MHDTLVRKRETAIASVFEAAPAWAKGRAFWQYFHDHLASVLGRKHAPPRKDTV